MTMYHITDNEPVSCDRGVLCKSGAHYTTLTAAYAAISTTAAPAVYASTAATAQPGRSGGGFLAGVGEFAADALDAAGGLIGAVAEIINIFD